MVRNPINHFAIKTEAPEKGEGNGTDGKKSTSTDISSISGTQKSGGQQLGEAKYAFAASEQKRCTLKRLKERIQDFPQLRKSEYAR
jgi:hypothetical protein